MRVSELRELCLSLEDATESTPFAPDRVVYKWAPKNKVFAIVSGHEAPITMVTLKMPPEEVVSLRDKYPTILPAYKQNKKYWSTTPLDGEVPDSLIIELVEQSYLMVRIKARESSRRCCSSAPCSPTPIQSDV
ncbi:MAG: hypothetical protein JWM76_4075 [Pseudonocardiales bacterium]|nr:hypothetical protein [Pseudonocardiales bacterium]